MKYVFKPAPKAFGETAIMRTIDVNVMYDADKFMAMLNGKMLSTATIAHAVAFAIKQRLANSYVSAATAKNEAGGLLPVSERLDLWQSSFDKVLAKMCDPNAAPNWESVFAEGRSSESIDPVGSEVNKIVRAKLVAWAKAKGKTLPKADTPEYSKLREAVLAKQGTAIRSAAESIVAARNAASGDDELDIGDMSDESDGEEAEDQVPNV